MKKIASLLVLISIGALTSPPALSSGSILAGKGINPRDAYTRGKALTFQKLVCADCPLQSGNLDRTRAESLKASLEARDALEKPGTRDDEYILVLCPGNRGTDCDSEVDEQELVHYYLTRRFKL